MADTAIAPVGRILRSRTTRIAPVPVEGPSTPVKRTALDSTPPQADPAIYDLPLTPKPKDAKKTRSTKVKTSKPITKSKPKAKTAAAEPKSTPKDKNSRKPTRTVYAVGKTPSFTESFDGRLNWKTRHFVNPVTSTPVAESKRKPRFTVENGFGFNDDDESFNISPIQKLPVSSIGNSGAAGPSSPVPSTSRGLVPIRFDSPRPGLAPFHCDSPRPISKLAMEPCSTPPAVPLQEGAGNSPRKSTRTGPGCQKAKANPILATKSKPKPIGDVELTETPKENEIHNFSELWDAYGNDDEAKKELGEFYIDPKSIKRTYGGRKSGDVELEEENEVPNHIPTKLKSKESKSTKKVTIVRRTRKTKNTEETPSSHAPSHTHKTKEAHYKPSELDWFEKKRKEFEEIDNFQLKVEKTTHAEGDAE